MTGDITLSLDEQLIERVFRGSLDSLRQAQQQMFEFSEAARDERARLKLLIEQAKEQVEICIRQVDELEAQSDAARARLAKISRNFARFSNEEIREAYERAERTMVALGAARERERMLRQHRDDLERQLRRLEQLLGKAERVVTQVSVALDFLSGNLAHVTTQVEGMRERAAVAHQVIRAQEEERRRLAREIHDGPAQLLANLLLRLDILERTMRGDPEQVQAELQGIKGLVRESLRELRRSIVNLRPMVLDDLGLVPTLRGYLEALKEQTGLEAEVQVLGREQRLSSTAEAALFRVAQEAIHNAQRHGKCRQVVVRLEFGPSGIGMLVQDDGTGFDPEALAQSGAETGFGLLHMRERVHLLQGEFRLM
ncbi:MAG: histidine kinase, partial [Limnochordales bacterium]